MFNFIFFPREISEVRGPTGVKFCTVVSTRLVLLCIAIPLALGKASPVKFGPVTMEI